jgi:hypothetical protein
VLALPIALSGQKVAFFHLPADPVAGHKVGIVNSNALLGDRFRYLLDVLFLFLEHGHT